MTEKQDMALPTARATAAEPEVSSLRGGIANAGRDDFVRRFKNRMLQVAGPTFDDGSSIAEYADEIAPSYFETDWQRELGPEECADADISYWGE